MDLETFRWLLTDDGQSLLEQASDFQDPLRAGTQLRKQFSGAHVAAALTQIDLRRKAVDKFGDAAALLYFTPDALEQATRLPIANHRAARVRAASATSIVDLGCGIGGDLIANARAGLTVVGVESDPVRAAIAEANLAALNLGGAVTCADATTINTAPFDVAFADPARRSGRGRTFSPDNWTPSWDFVEALLRRDSCVKVAPGIPHDLVPDGVEAEWISDRGDLKEAALWGGRLATTARRATVISARGLATLTDEDDSAETVAPIDAFLYEPDDAVIRAGLVGGVAAGVGGHLIDPKIAYVTSSQPFMTPFATTYGVVEELPFHEKPLRAALRERNVGRLTIKKRGVQVVPEELRKRLQLSGDQEATIVLTRASNKGICLLVRPLRG